MVVRELFLKQVTELATSRINFFRSKSSSLVILSIPIPIFLPHSSYLTNSSISLQRFNKLFSSSADPICRITGFASGILVNKKPWNTFSNSIGARSCGEEEGNISFVLSSLNFSIISNILRNDPILSMIIRYSSWESR